MKKQIEESIRQFAAAFNRGLDGIKEAGQIADRETKKDDGWPSRAVAASLCPLKLNDIHCIIRIGNGEMMPQTLFAAEGGESLLRDRASGKLQKKLWNKPVMVAFRDEDGKIKAKKMLPREMNAPTAARVYGAVGEPKPRSLKEQKRLLSNITVLPKPKTVKFVAHGVKQAHKHLNECEACLNHVQKHCDDQARRLKAG